VTEVPAELRPAHLDPVLAQDELERHDQGAPFVRVELLEHPPTDGLVTIGRPVVFQGELP
jgi:hypothetical protein